MFHPTFVRRRRRRSTCHPDGIYRFGAVEVSALCVGSVEPIGEPVTGLQPCAHPGWGPVRLVPKTHSTNEWGEIATLVVPSVVFPDSEGFDGANPRSPPAGLSVMVVGRSLVW